MSIISFASCDETIARALAFASQAHAEIGQVRKYSNDPYIVHPIAVAEIVMTVPHTRAQIISALCHDVVEDTKRKLAEIEAEFGSEVAGLVDDLTDISKPSDGNRSVRKAIDLAHTARARPAAKTIKLADLLDNTESITLHDPNFAVYYMKEKRALLEVLTEGDATLWQKANAHIETYFKKLDGTDGD
jgi:(p)ppGpp synthase/HD superfamily hydrolase